MRPSQQNKRNLFDHVKGKRYFVNWQYREGGIHTWEKQTKASENCESSQRTADFQIYWSEDSLDEGCHDV